MARPQKISDAELDRVIAELRAHTPLLTGIALRAELHRRFGLRAGTNRVYRLLRTQAATASSPSPAAPPSPASDASESAARIAELEQQLATALRRAELAEHREQAHQDKWANEIYELRAEVQRLRGWGR